MMQLQLRAPGEAAGLGGRQAGKEVDGWRGRGAGGQSWVPPGEVTGVRGSDDSRRESGE